MGNLVDCSRAKQSGHLVAALGRQDLGLSVAVQHCDAVSCKSAVAGFNARLPNAQGHTACHCMIKCTTGRQADGARQM